MFKSKINTTTAIMLIAVTCGGVSLTAYRLALAGQNTSPQIPPPTEPLTEKEVRQLEKDAANKDAKAPTETAPIGFFHDFGKVQRGIIAKHTFHIFNTSHVPLRIISVRAS